MHRIEDRPDRGATALVAMLVGALYGCSGGGSNPADVRDALDAVAEDAAGEEDAAAADDGVGAEDGADVSDPVSEEFLTGIVEVLASEEMDGRQPGTAGWAAARTFIEERMTACGLSPAGSSGWEQAVEGDVGINVLGRVQGSDPARRDRVIIVGAHYDHLGDCGGAICNGAYDNATAVAAALAVGCALVAAPPARSVLIAIWDTEEPPYFLDPEMGSQYYVDHPLVPLPQTDAAIALDLMGEGLWPGFMGHVVLGAELSPEVAAAVDVAEVPAGLLAHRLGLHAVEDTAMGHQPWSDYDAFRNAGRPVLFLSDGQNKTYHQPTDEVSRVDFAKLLLETRYLLRIVSGLGDAATNPTFVADGADYARDAASVLVVLDAALASGGLVDALGLGASVRTKLEQDRTAVLAVQATLEGGGTLSAAEIGTLRTATQRVMCLAGSTYPDALCMLL
ncbi:MAG: M28 family peptidase [Deltaproteobacteria bacterium]|nr:M28 family peptidase [Deltaproteobacteria bacterium]